jgi:sugar phosphate isomerase/epimerase
VDHLKKVMVAAERLGLKRVNTFVGRDWLRTVDENWPRFLKTWRPLIAFAEDPNFRAFTEASELLFINAVLLGPAY